MDPLKPQIPQEYSNSDMKNSSKESSTPIHADKSISIFERITSLFSSSTTKTKLEGTKAEKLQKTDKSGVLARLANKAKHAIGNIKVLLGIVSPKQEAVSTEKVKQKVSLDTFMKYTESERQNYDLDMSTKERQQLMASREGRDKLDAYFLYKYELPLKSEDVHLKDLKLDEPTLEDLQKAIERVNEAIKPIRWAFRAINSRLNDPIMGSSDTYQRSFPDLKSKLEARMKGMEEVKRDLEAKFEAMQERKTSSTQETPVKHDVSQLSDQAKKQLIEKFNDLVDKVKQLKVSTENHKLAFSESKQEFELKSRKPGSEERVGTSEKAKSTVLKIQNLLVELLENECFIKSDIKRLESLKADLKELLGPALQHHHLQEQFEGVFKDIEAKKDSFPDKLKFNYTYIDYLLERYNNNFSEEDLINVLLESGQDELRDDFIKGAPWMGFTEKGRGVLNDTIKDKLMNTLNEAFATNNIEHQGNALTLIYQLLDREMIEPDDSRLNEVLHKAIRQAEKDRDRNFAKYLQERVKELARLKELQTLNEKATLKELEKSELKTLLEKLRPQAPRELTYQLKNSQDSDLQAIQKEIVSGNLRPIAEAKLAEKMADQNLTEESKKALIDNELKKIAGGKLTEESKAFIYDVILRDQLQKIAEGKLAKEDKEAFISQFAQDLTAITTHLFKNIQRTEFYGNAWNDDKKAKDASPNIVAFTENSNNIRNFIIYKILELDGAEERQHLVETFLEIADHMAHRQIPRNYQGAMDICSAFIEPAIARLAKPPTDKDQPENLLTDRSQKLLANLNTVFNSPPAYHELRVKIAQDREDPSLSLILPMSVYLRDFFQGSENSPSKLPSGALNLNKARILANLHDDVESMQSKVKRNQDLYMVGLPNALKETPKKQPKELDTRSRELRPPDQPS